MTTTTVSALVIPMDESQPIYSLSIPASPISASAGNGDDDLEMLTRTLQQEDSNSLPSAAATIVRDVRQRLLVRSSANGTAGLYAFDVPLLGATADATEENGEEDAIVSTQYNIRATRLAMACGLFSCCQSWGNVLLVRASISSRVHLGEKDGDNGADEEGIYGACCISPDLRRPIQQQLHNTNDNQQYSKAIAAWLGNAHQQNYHDTLVLSQLAKVMTTVRSDVSLEDSDHDKDDSQGHDSDSSSPSSAATRQLDPATGSTNANSSSSASAKSNARTFVTRQPLCLHCRKPANTLCSVCKACYFCDDTPESQCRKLG